MRAQLYGRIRRRPASRQMARRDNENNNIINAASETAFPVLCGAIRGPLRIPTDYLFVSDVGRSVPGRTDASNKRRRIEHTPTPGPGRP